ncbi:pimeloyl-ACP methyl ester carboxylesterase [Microbacterium natoriense]|uniref:Pimeloyl-ACP methyl ester carboxylesterase n=2 Tax=Microbacterium natoriense TaxID=284570 RepID=A0AAW8EZG3_9MICO|nr:pimeloyl-ACP methyl ester carboxylesterase [Microbacterium natoriense]
MKKSEMKKSAKKKALVAVAAVMAVVAVGLTTTTIVNVVATGIEKERIDGYGQLISVNGQEMNVVITGDGPQDVVLLPGFGTASPALDFAPLVAELSEDHRVIVVEPFGYGLSDGTDRERTTENIVTEVHAALAQLDIDRYALMGHSIAGLYAIEFAERFPDEVSAFVGIDSSVPGQPHMDTQFPTGLLGAAKNLGLVRLAAAFAGAEYDESVFSHESQVQMALLANRNSLAPTYLNEMARIRISFSRALGTEFPEDLPLLLFVREDDEASPDWLALHDRQAAAVADGTVVSLVGGHYLHHTQSPRIAEELRRWESARMPDAS